MAFIFVILFTALYLLFILLASILLNALFLKLSVRMVCKRNYNYSSACRVSLKVILISTAVYMPVLGIKMVPDLKDNLLVDVVVFPIYFMLGAFLYGRFINSRRGIPIGLKRGTLVQLVQTAAYILISIPFYILGIYLDAP